MTTAPSEAKSAPAMPSMQVMPCAAATLTLRAGSSRPPDAAHLPWPPTAVAIPALLPCGIAQKRALRAPQKLRENVSTSMNALWGTTTAAAMPLASTPTVAFGALAMKDTVATVGSA